MIFSKLWERYIFREFLKFFSFFLFGFYLLYVLVDYSTHAQDFVQGQGVPIWKILQYYLFQFVKRADILLPLALLISTVKVLADLGQNKELLALQSAGIPLRRLVSPLLFFGGLSTLLILGIHQFATPHSLNFIDKFHDAHLRHSYRGKRPEPLHAMHLEDHTKLIYDHYDAAKEAFFDVIWIKSHDDIWKMKYLKADPENPLGEWIDHLSRNDDGFFVKTESYPSLLLRDLVWNENLPRCGFIPFENRSISALWNEYRSDQHLSIYEKGAILTQILFKCTMPFLTLLVVLGAAPYVTTYSRTRPLFMIYGLALFGFVAFIALMDAMVILGESTTLAPTVAVLSPFIMASSLFFWRFVRAR